MASRSDPVLTWLRDLVQKRGLNTAELSRRCELPRARLRKVLAGAEPMLVDELLAISNALELSPADMGMPQLEGAPDEPPESGEPAEDSGGIDMFGNHVEQLFRVGFALGCDFFFEARLEALDDSGVPEQVLGHYRDLGVADLPIKLDATYHQYNEPRYGDSGITLTLSFSTGLHDCTFPWAAVRRVIFFPEPFEQPETEPDRPVLRLVT